MIDLAIMAARSALAVCRIPRTAPVGYEERVDKESVGMMLDTGISGLVKGGKAGSKAVDFELLDGGWEEGERLRDWEQLPVGITLNLVRSLSIVLTRKFELTDRGLRLLSR